MFERDVTVSLNADVSGYTSSLSQAIAITKQYQDSTTGVLATIAKMSSATVSGIVGIAPGLTGARRVITDTAAAYQQQLSGIAAATVNTSASIEGVTKSTRQLARDFPVGMGQAVQQVMSLKSAGVVTEKEISRLGVAFTKLGAANNAFGPELGQQMLQVTRQFGNSTSQVEALGDSLTTVTKQWGANASSVLQFSKAIAPIASTVGMSQTQVMGLSTAMSRLGEDGFAAGNAVNKVLLDMNKAVRQGGPELKVYADLMGMTAENLRSLAKSNPSEVLARFTESIARQGPAAQRPLEALGFDSIRTTRAITSLANTGNLREIMDTAVKAYGNGETERSAAEAFGTVNDKMQELQETMSQTMDNLGKPFLKFTGVVLSAGKAAAGAAEKVTGSTPFQSAATGGIVAGALAGGAWKVLSATTTGSMLLNLFRTGRDSQFAKDFGAGREMGRMGYTSSNVQGANAATRLGMLTGNVQGPPASEGTGVRAIGSIRDRVATTVRTVAGAGVRLTDAMTNENIRAGGGTPIPQSPTGIALRTAIGDALRGRDMQTLQAANSATSRYLAGLSSSGGLGRVVGSAGMYAYEGGRQAMVYGARGLGMVGRGMGALGLNPAMLGVAGVGVGAYMLYQQEQASRERMSGITDNSNKDIFASFNSFAEAAGMAGRGLVDFTAAVRQATSAMAKQSTTWDQSKSLTSEEQAQAQSPGYTRAFNITGDAAKGGPGAAAVITEQAKMTLGASATPEAVKKLTMDVLNQTKNSALANDVANSLADSYGQSAQPVRVDYATVIKDMAANASGFALAGSDETAKLGLDLGRSIAQTGYQTGQVRSPEAGQIVSLAETKKAFGLAQTELNKMPGVGPDSSRRTQAATAFNAMLTSALGLSEDQMTEIFGNPNQQKDFLLGGTWDELVSKLEAYSKDKDVSIPALDTLDAAKRNNIDINNPKFGGTIYDKPTSLEDQSKDLVNKFKEMTGVVATTSTSLFEMNAAARGFEKDITALTPEDIRRSGMSKSGKLDTKAYQNETVGNVSAAAMQKVVDALRNSGGNTTTAIAELQRTAAIAPADTRERIMQEALAQAESIAAPREAARPSMARTLDTYRLGRQTQTQVNTSGPSTDENIATVQKNEIASGRNAQATMIANMRNFLLQAKQTQIAISQMEAQAGRQMFQVQRDYNLQVQYANEDYQRTRFRATRDFNIQMTRMDRDYGIQRTRAMRDFNRQEKWALQDHNREKRYAEADQARQLSRMAFDYNRQKQRAEADFNVTTTRMIRDANRQRQRMDQDFYTSVSRMAFDYNRQKLRATEDYGTSVSRAEADYQLARERATRDFTKQQSYAEADYLKQRSRAVEDYNKQMKRMVEDSAKSLHDPYKRIQAQLVMDGGQLVANLREQNTSVRKQMEALDKLRSSGLSQNAIDILGLGDTKNAQQTMRLLADSLSDPTLIQKLNEQIAGRVDLAGMVTSGDNNQAVRRMSEDFAVQLDRMATDFDTATARAKDAFSTSMSDMEKDHRTQMERAADDFLKSMTRMTEDYTTTLDRATQDHNKAVERLSEDLATALANATEDHNRAMQYMDEDYATAVQHAVEDYTTAMQRMQEAYDIVVSRTRRQFAIQLKDMAEDHRKIRRDAKDDFERQMSDMAENLQVQLKRMATAVSNALSDIGSALAAQVEAAQKSLIAFGQVVATKETGIYKQFAEFISGLPADQKKNMGESLREMMRYLSEESPKIFHEYFPNGFPGIPLWGNARPAPGPQDRQEGWVNPTPATPPYGSGPGGAPPMPAPSYPGPSWLTPPGGGVDPSTWPGYSTTPNFTPPSPAGWGTPSTSDSSLYPWLSSGGKAAEDAGTQTAEGYIKGVEAALRKWLPKEVVDDFVTKWKRELGIASPSKVFMEIGQDTIAGFIKGIVDNLPGVSFMKDKVITIFADAQTWLKGLPQFVSDWIGVGTIFSKISKVLPSMAEVGKEIEGRFDTFKSWLGNLPNMAAEWIGSGKIFKKLKETFPGLKEVSDEIEGRFNTAKAWLANLPTNVTAWIKSNKLTIVDGIMAAFPNITSMKKAIDEWFSGDNGPKAWFGNLVNQVKAWMPGGDAWKTLFSNSIGQGFESFVNSLISKWNSFELKLGPLTISILGAETTIGPWTLDTPYVSPVNWFAQGGIVSGAQVVGVGEAGPEAIVPLNQRGAQVMADAMKRYINGQVFDGSLASPTVINVQMADVNIDFTDSGTEFESQTAELLARVRETARTSADLVDANAKKITADVDDVSKALEDLAKTVSGTFDEVGKSLEEALKGAANSTNEETRSIAQSFSTMTDSMDTDLTDLVSGFGTSVDTIISDTDQLIRDALQRIEDFANQAISLVPDSPDTSNPGTPDQPPTPPATPPPPGSAERWSMFSTGYTSLKADDKTYINSLFGGKAPTEETFSALSQPQQDALVTTMVNAGIASVRSGGGISSQDKATLGQLFPGATNPGGGTPGGGAPGGGTPGRDTSYSNFNTLQKSLGSSDQQFLKTSFGGSMPTSTTWQALTQHQRDVLIDALADKDITTSERATISGLGLSASGPEDGNSDKTKATWDAFKSGYDKLGKNDKALVDQIFVGAPTFDTWSTLTDTQQRRLRDIVADGNIGKDEKDDFNSVGSKMIGARVVKEAERQIGKPYKKASDPPNSFNCSTLTQWAYRSVGISLPDYSDSQWQMGRDVTGQEQPGDIVFFSTGRVDNGYHLITGHVGIYTGNGKMIDAPDVGMNVQPDEALGRSNYKGARRYFAEGGVVARRQDAVIGEAGPEVVMPLNDRGAEFFANVMQRYATPQDSQRALVSPYSTPVNVSISHTYDNRTMFTGPIAVSANDPDELAARTAAKQRRQRLSQPIGSAR